MKKSDCEKLNIPRQCADRFALIEDLIRNHLTHEIQENQGAINAIHQEVIQLREDMGQNTANMTVVLDRLNAIYIKLKHVNVLD